MAFADHIVRRGCALRPYVTISGLPYIWSNGAPPDGWETSPGSGVVQIAGESYTWLRTLIADEAFASVAQSANATGGVGVTGEHSFRFAVAGDVGASSDAWLSIAYADSIARTGSAVTRGLEVLAPDETIDYQVENAADFAAGGGVAHVGIEAIAYSTTTTGGGESLDTLTRGRYESTARHHLGGDDLAEQLSSGGAPFVSAHPLAWQGRIVRLWLAPCRTVNGVLVPESSACRGAEDAEAFAGVLDSISQANGGTEIEVVALGVLHLLASEIATRLPRATAGLPDPSKHVQIAEDNRSLSWTWTFTDTSALPIRHYNATPIIDPVVFTSTPLTIGLHSMAQIAGGIGRTMREGDNPSAVGELVARVTLDDDQKAIVTVTGVAGGLAGAGWNLKLNSSVNDSFWREIGFEGDTEATPSISGSNDVWTFTANRRLPVFRLPAGQGVRRVYYHTPSGPNFDATPGYVTDQGAGVDGALLLGNQEVVEFDASGSDSGFAYLSISNRAAYGSDSSDEIYVEWNPSKPKPLEIVQGLGFNGVGDYRAALYLLLGGSGTSGFNNATYDKGWRGSGAFVPSSLIDVTSFETINNSTQPPTGRDNRFIASATSLREWLHGVLVETQGLPIATWTTADARFKLRAAQASPPRESDRAAAHVLDRSVIWTGGADKIEPEIDQGKIVNSAVVRTGLNNASGVWLQQQNSIDATSVGTWGRKDRLSFDVGSTSDPLEAQDIAVDLLGSVYRSLGIPWAIISVPTGSPDSWTWQLSDKVLVSHTALPKRLSVGRGVTDLLGVIVGKVDRYRGASNGAVRSMLRILVADYGSSRWGLRAPCCRGTVAGSTVASIEDHAYSATGDALDITYFPVDTVCRIYLRGDEASAVLRTVTVNAGTTLTFGSAIGLVGEVVVEFAPHSTASVTEAQKWYAHMSDGDGVLDLDGGSAVLAYRWL